MCFASCPLIDTLHAMHAFALLLLLLLQQPRNSRGPKLSLLRNAIKDLDCCA
jgi:hypothetical protein